MFPYQLTKHWLLGEFLLFVMISPPRTIRNVSLIGFMGVGKSSTGHLLAESLGFEFVDTDLMIEQRVGKTITEIFAQYGEPAFRDLERQVGLLLEERSRTVISTGGGFGSNPENLARLKTHSLVVCLWASPETILERVRHQTHRPLLRDADPLSQIRSLLSAREAAYRQADVLVNTESRSSREVAQQIAHHFQAALR